MEYYFDPDDKLERKKYAEFLKSMLENCDNYRREDSDGAYVIAIDSPWGTGKTRFAKMLRNFLESRSPRVIEGKVDQSYIPEPDDARKFNVIYYNSWETDYWNYALEPLIFSIYESRILEIEGAEADNEIIKVAVFQILKGMGFALLKLALGEAGATVFQGALDGLDKVPSDPLMAFKDRMNQYSEFQKALESVIERTGKKLVIIIDELDRCRPTFAIQTLEIAKHLFAVRNLVFIFALDINQLSHSVQTVYGQGMDAPGYLCRFFDYLSKMPQPSIGQFIDDLLGDLRPNQQFYPDNDFRLMLIGYIWGLAIIHSLSLRDVSTLITSYRILFKVCLANYPDISAHQLYLYLLVLKYKNRLNYEHLLLGKLTIETIKENFSESITIKHGENHTKQSRRLELLGTNKSIENVVYSTYNCINGEKSGGRLFGRFFALGDIKNPNMKYYIKTEHSQQTGGYDFQDTENLEQVLYYEDLKKWETIKLLTLGQYYYQQLEMFNFALPADEPETQP